MSQIATQPQLYDWTGKAVSSASAPVTNRTATALTSPQGGIITLGSDYASTPNAQTPKVDASGQLYNVPSSAGGVPIGTLVNTTIAAGQSYAGFVSLAFDATNNRYTPFQVDATGAGVIRNSLAITGSFSPSTVVNTGAAGKSMLSVYNASTTNYQRILGFYAQCPPQAAVTGGLLQTNTSYTAVPMAAYRFTSAHTGGTVIPVALHDTRDSYDASFTCRTGATCPNQAAASLCVFDAALAPSLSYGHREDVGVKVFTIAPGEGITFNNLTALGTNGVNFYLRLVTAQNTA